MKMFALAVATLSLVAASTADARPLGTGGCPIWMCGANGPFVNCIALHGTALGGIRLQAGNSAQPVVKAVTLPSGETFDLR
jgi:hypothetical protein